MVRLRRSTFVTVAVGAGVTVAVGAGWAMAGEMVIMMMAAAAAVTIAAMFTHVSRFFGTSAPIRRRPIGSLRPRTRIVNWTTILSFNAPLSFRFINLWGTTKATPRRRAMSLSV